MTTSNPEPVDAKDGAGTDRRISRRTALGWFGAAGVVGTTGFIGGRLSGDAGDRERDDRSGRLGPAESTASGRADLPAGVASPIPACGHILAIDLSETAGDTPDERRTSARDLLVAWSDLAEQLAHQSDPSTVAAAGADMRPASLEFTIGFGASLLHQCGLQDRQPESLVSLPPFAVDRLVTEQSDGDFMIQLGAEDPMRLAGAVQAVLTSLADRARIRWSARGFGQSAAASTDPRQTARNIMGHRDGTNNPERSSSLWETVVTAREGAGPAQWMDGGSYAVVRQIEIGLESWFALSTRDRDVVIGRETASGAALGHSHEHDPVELARRDGSGELMIDQRAHIRLSSAENVAGQRIFRRSWNFDHGPQVDGRRAGMLFVAWQADPRRGFIPIQQSLDAGNDLLSEHVRHVGSAVFAVPPQRAGDRYVGQALFET